MPKPKTAPARWKARRGASRSRSLPPAGAGPSKCRGPCAHNEAHGMKRPRILLADDQALTAEGLERLLSPRADVVGTVGDGRALVEVAARVKPDIILLDVSMPEMNGMAAARRLRHRAAFRQAHLRRPPRRRPVRRGGPSTWASPAMC